MTQTEQVLAALERLGGCATLKQLYQETVSHHALTWKTRTPFASVRRIVQQSDAIRKIKPGLYCLEKDHDKFKYLTADTPVSKKNEPDRHGYYQGLLLELGRMRGYSTYTPTQDRKRLAVPGGKRLMDLCDISELPKFGYPELMRHAKTIDVIWFNERRMPASLFEVEYTTSFLRSLEKFSTLRDYAADMYIVSNRKRMKTFERKKLGPAFSDMQKRIQFWSFEKLGRLHEAEARRMAAERSI